MNRKRVPRGALPADQQTRAQALTTFVVDEYGTLSQHGVPDPQTHADLNPDVDPADIRGAKDAIEVLESHPGIVSNLTTWVECELEEVESLLEDLPPDSPCAVALGMLKQQLSDAVDDWEPWVRTLPPHGLDPIRQAIAAWLVEPIDWGRCEVPLYAGAQGCALAFFESLPLDSLESLGVELVYGDHPGSTYFAAELKSDPDEATAAADDLGLGIRFLREGETAADAEPSCPASAAPPSAPKSASKPAPGRTDPFQAVFHPRFGVRPDMAWGVEAGPADAWPPVAVRHLHTPWLFQAAWRRVVDGIREPVQVYSDAKGCRHVHVLAAAVYSFAADGTMSGCLWTTSRELSPSLVAATTAELTVEGVPWRWLWLQRWLRAFAFEVASVALQQGQSVVPAEIDQYVEWVFKLFRGRIRRGCDLRTMRRRIALGLNLDPQTTQVARQLCLTERQPRVTMALYNRVLEHRMTHGKLVSDAPGLQLTYAVLCHEDDALVGAEPPCDEPLERLRRRVRAHGLSTRLWRTLLNCGARLWRPMERFYSRCDTEAAWDYLCLVDMMGWRTEPDPMFMQLVLAQHGSSDRRRELYGGRVERESRLLRLCVQRFESLDAAGSTAMLAELPTVLTWLGKAAPALKATRAPAWRTLLKRARRNEADRLRLTVQETGAWACPRIEGIEGRQDDVEVVLLRSAHELYEEGSVMRHCALSYATDCADGKALVGSVRDRRTGKRIATVLWVCKQQRWAVAEVVGFANGPAPDRAVGAVVGKRLH